MYAVSEKFKEAAYSRSRNVAVRVTFNGTTVLDGKNIIDITIKETITSNEKLTMGDACSSMAKVKFLMPAEVLPLHGSYFKAEVGLMVDGAFEYCPLGTYYVTDFETKDNFRIVEVTAYDGMSKLNNKYETTLESFPAPIADVLSDIQDQYPGIVNLAKSTYPNYMVDYVDCTAREMIGYIAGLLGCNARINRDNQLAFCWYSGKEEIDDDAVYMNGYINSTKEEYVFSSITVGELEVGSGSGIEFSNPFITPEIMGSILAEKGNVSYMPATLKYRCNPSVECGDICVYGGKQIFVMSQTIKISGGMSSTISCFTGESNTVMKESPTDRKIGKVYSELTESFKIATDLLKGARGGYFEILTDEQGFPTGWTIRDTAEVIDTTRMWLMNYAGLAFSSDGGKTYSNVAITMDGQISADAITTGSLSSNLIQVEGVGENLTNYFKIQAETIEGNITEKYQSAIEQNSTNVLIEISKTYATQESLDKEKEKVSSMQDSVANAAETVNKINAFYQFTVDGFIIGKEGSEVKSIQDNDSYEFVTKAGDTILGINIKGVNAPTVNVEKQITYFEQWAVRRGAYVDEVGYNLNDVWIGG